MVYVLDSAVKMGEMLTIRFKRESDGKWVDGSILADHLTNRPTKRTKALEIIKQRRKVKAPAKGEEPILSPEQFRGLFEHGYQLEKLDDLHREPKILDHCFARWRNTPAGKAWKPQHGEAAPPAFFTYVSELEKKHDIHLVAKVKDYIGSKLFAGSETREQSTTTWVEERKAKNLPIIPRITYLEAGPGSRGREQYRLAFTGNKLSYVTGGPVPLESHIYVMTAGMEFFGKPETAKTQVNFHHSSFLKGENVGAAGKFEFDGGKPIIDIESGHYRPTLQHAVNALRGLEHKGASMDLFDARPIPTKKQKFNARAFLNIAKLLQSLPEKELDKITKASDKKRLKILKGHDVIDDSLRLKYIMTTGLREKLKNLNL
jgi:hypothetical protein